jgi:hypothetical protein
MTRPWFGSNFPDVVHFFPPYLAVFGKIRQLIIIRNHGPPTLKLLFGICLYIVNCYPVIGATAGYFRISTPISLAAA